jgi:DNA-binding NarL/FixJ family response regulator
MRAKREISRKSTVDFLQKGREALSCAAWRKARAAFERALRNDENAGAWEGLANAAWWLGDFPTVFRARDRAYRLHRQSADRRGAARLALAIAGDSLNVRGEPDVARGWHRRARRLLEGLPPSPELGWLRMWEADLAISVDGDPTAATALAREGAAIGRRLGAVDIEMACLATEGLALVTSGRVAEGIPLLDEAAAAALGGEIENPVVGTVALCDLLNACEQVRDFRRAAQWLPRVREFCRRLSFHSFFSFCRVLHSGLLVWNGRWGQAERDLLDAIRRFQHGPIRTESCSRLAELRRRQGRWREAAAILGKLEGHAPSLLVRANLALARGDPASAAEAAERFLRRYPEESRTVRFAAMESLLRSRLAQADPAGAAKALSELRAAASAIGTDAARAGRRFAEGLVLSEAGRREAARDALEDAADLYHRCGAPYERANARFELGRVLGGSGEKARAREELGASADGFRRLGATREAARARAALRTVERSPDGRTSAALRPGGLSRREAEIARLIPQGLRNREIASQLHLSEFTVKRHVANILAKLRLPSRAAAAAFATRHGLA